MNNKQKLRMSARPPASPASAEEFIAAAETPRQVLEEKHQENEAGYPWTAPQVRQDVIKTVNLRLPEPLYIKLQYVSEKTRKSQQELIREGLLQVIDKELAQLL